MSLISGPAFFAAIGAILLLAGLARMFTAADLVARVVALNVAGAGSLLLLVALSAVAQLSDPVPQALALTGIVITVAVTGVALALVRRIESGNAAPAPPDTTGATSATTDGAPGPAGGQP